ncbi:MAG: ABC transporter permease [Anaerolineae bacterium]|nr:ABC transporter permease [Anaerolineae bacterium]
MILKYVLKNFRRRKVRTILMVLSLMVSMGLLVAMSATVETIRRSNVELISSAIGRYDLRVVRMDTSPDPFVPVSSASQAILQADDHITAVHPRFIAETELNANGRTGNVTLIAIDPAENIGQVEVVEGSYDLGEMADGEWGTAVLEQTARAYNLQVGDTVDVAYSFPQPREKGQPSPAGASQRRAAARFTVTGIVRQNGVVGDSVNDGLLVNIAAAQSFLGLPDRAGQIIVLVDPALYEAGNAETAALAVRNVAVQVQAALGDQYMTVAEKASALDQSAEMFLVLQALINTYGLMALGVVGLLVHTLVMTNVQEQKREMAVLRILGSQRNLLFALVIAEVTVIGLVGVGLGIVLGQVITHYAVIPFIEWQMREAGFATTIQPAVSVTAILPALVAAFVVLFLSALRPAQDAAKTKVIHAINPGAANNIQLEDLEALRERRPNLKLFIIGLGMMFVVLMVIGLDIVSTFGYPAAEAAIFLAAVLMMVVGVGFVFFIVTRPMEKVLLAVMGLLSPRLTFFAQRNVGRGHARNTLISLLVLFSGVLPSFLATQMAMSNANIETDVRLNMGAPVEMNTFARYAGDDEVSRRWRLPPSFLTEELGRVPGLGTAVGLSRDYFTDASDAIGMRNGRVTAVGVVGDLSAVLYPDMMIFTGGGPAALAQILQEPDTVIISEGLAEGLAVPLGGVVKIRGEGLDHMTEMRVVGIVRRLPGFPGIGRVRSQALGGGTVLLSLDSFRRLTTPLQTALPPPDDPILDRILATVTPGADVHEVDSFLRDRYGLERGMWTRLADVQLQRARDNQVQQQVFLLVLTLISFTTAVFGVFAVIYVTVYARRLEIGMMKAVGTRSWELTGMLIVESIAMTLSAALAGILAGATMGYLFAYADNLTAQRPMRFAIDTTVMPFIVIMVVLASVIGAAFSARRIVKRKAVEILRMG